MPENPVTPCAETPACCPRCGSSFACGAAGAHCACFDVKLPEALRADLAQRYTGCLCLACLRELRAGSANAGAPGNAPG